MEESTILGITASQIPLAALMLTIAGVLIAVIAFVAVQVNNSLSALRADLNALRSEMNANIGGLRSETRADFRALEERFERRFDTLSADVVGLKIDLAQIKGMLGIAENVADASAGGE